VWRIIYSGNTPIERAAEAAPRQSSAHHSQRGIGYFCHTAVFRSRVLAL